MSFDFPLFLVIASAVTGGIWLVDAVLFAPRRRALAAEAQAAQAAVSDSGQPALPVVAAGYREPVLVEYARSFFPVIFVVLLLRSFVIEPFRIPSNSMMPTLLTGDFIVVNKFAYGLRWPVLDEKFIEIGDPKRGDVVVFRYPVDQQTDYIKRVVGVPGDKLYYRDKTLFINGKPVEQTSLGRYVGEGSGAVMSGAREALENLSGVEHRILTRDLAPDMPPGCPFMGYDPGAPGLPDLHGPVQVPDGYYFVMGDNRDNSSDSRCWGFVPDENLKGRAFMIWMHWDGAREGFPIEWGRIGDLLD